MTESFKNTAQSTYPFLRTEGEMTAIIKDLDWEDHPLGPIASWPKALHNILFIMLRAKFPMFLFWGKELICFYNDAYRPSLGEDGKHPFMLGAKAKNVWSEVFEIIDLKVNQVFSGGPSTFDEDQMVEIYRNGAFENTYWTYSYSPILGDHEEIGGVLVTCLETTEKNEILHRLEESEKRFKRLADDAPVMISITNTEHEVKYINQAWFKFAGEKIKQTMDSDIFHFMHPNDREACKTLYKNAKSEKKSYRTEFRVKNKNNVYRWISETGTPQISLSGHFSGFVKASMDINDIKKLEIKKDLFISMASHELKTPITTIKGYVQLLQQYHLKKGDDTTEKILRTVNTQIDTLTELVSDLLDLSKIKLGKVEFNFENLNISQFVSDIVEQSKLNYPNIVFNLDMCGNTNAIIDKDRMGQVLKNLISNAVKYAPNSEKIDLICTSQKNQIQISVRDYGIGISKENLTKIFRRFFRAHGNDEKVFPGMGIGLYITSEIIKKHNGKIWVESTLGEGSTFYVSIPVS